MLVESLRCKAPQESMEAQVFPRCGREGRVSLPGVDPDVSGEFAHTLSFRSTSVSQLLPSLLCRGSLPEAAVESSGEGLEITPLFRGQVDEDLKRGTFQDEGQMSRCLLAAPSIVESSQVDLCQVGLQGHQSAVSWQLGRWSCEEARVAIDLECRCDSRWFVLPLTRRAVHCPENTGAIR